jgi:NAD(P)-dependent dehydrogenase (short-subunit alcohol dehydrogenase family)
MDLQLNDKTALVTGSTGGIGLAIARKLAVEGAKVTIAGRSQAKLDEAVESIRISGGTHVNGVVVDAATTEGAAALLKAAPFVDILVNNLGIYEIRNFIDIPTRSGEGTSRSTYSVESGWREPIFRGCCGRTGAGSSSSPANPASLPPGR